MNKIIVTGYNGFIGAILTPLLVKNGYRVVGIDTDYYDKSCQLFSPEFQKVKQLKKDIRKINEQDIKGADIICHLAALSNDATGQLNEDLTLDINYKASLRLAKLAKKAGIKKFIFSSSCSVYGIIKDEFLTEKSDLNPLTAYARSKVLLEKSLNSLKNNNFSVTSLRNATAYGISPKLRTDLVVNNLVAWALITGKIRIMSDGAAWRPLVHVEDIARAFLATIEAEQEKINGEVFNVGRNSDNYQIKDIAFLIKKIVPKCEVLITKEYGSDARTYKVKFNKIAKKLPSFKPKWTLSKGIKQIYVAYKDYKVNWKKFNSRYFTRLRQIRYLLDNNKLNHKLYWK